MLGHLFILAGFWALSVNAKTNVTVHWSDNSVQYQPVLPNNNDPTQTWLATLGTDVAGASSLYNDGQKHPTYSYTRDVDASASFYFTGNALYFYGPLWPVNCRQLITISQYTDEGADGYFAGITEHIKLVNLTDPNAQTLYSNFPNYGDSDNTAENQLYWAKSLDFGTWNVTVTPVTVANQPFIASIGTFVFTNLTADDVAALDPSSRLPVQNVNLPSNSATPAQISAANNRADQNLRVGVIVGVVLGVVGFIAIVGAGIYLRRRRLRRVKFTIDDEDEGPSVLKAKELKPGASGYNFEVSPFTGGPSTDSKEESSSIESRENVARSPNSPDSPPMGSIHQPLVSQQPRLQPMRRPTLES